MDGFLPCSPPPGWRKDWSKPFDMSKSGTWTHHNLSWAIGAVPETTWQKLNHALAWLWDRPFWAVTTFVGLMVALLGSSVEA